MRANIDLQVFMKLFIQCRGFRTKAEVLFGNGNSGLLIQTLADKQSKEENRRQILQLLKSHNIISEQNFLVACAASVFIEPIPENKLYVAGDPHIACGFFDSALKLYSDSYQSKSMYIGSTHIGDAEYKGSALVKQSFVYRSSYQTISTTENHFFLTANKIVTSNDALSNGKEENTIVNAGGGFYLLAFKHPPCFSTFKHRVALYNQTSLYYDRLNNSCAHAVLESLDIHIPNRYALDTQTALALIIKRFSFNEPTILTDCLKDPIALGDLESKRLQRNEAILKDKFDYIKSYFQCK